MTSRTVLRPSWLLDPNGSILRDHAVVVNGGKIERVIDESRSGPTVYTDAASIDLSGAFLVPGLINLHTHVGAGPIARGISEDFDLPAGMPFYVPLSRLWRHAYTPELRELYRAVVEWDLLGMIRTGTTTVVNHASTDVVGYLELASRIGVRTFAGPTVPLDVTHRLGSLSQARAVRRDSTRAFEQHEELDGFRQLHSDWHGRNGLIDVLLGPAAAHAVNYAVLESVGALSEELGCLVTTHLCQAPSELEETQSRYGLSPLRVLDKAGLVSKRLLAAHGTYLPEEDLALAAQSGMTVVHCAARKAKEAIISPSVRLRTAGVSVGLGTDGFSCDMVEELKFAATLGKIESANTSRPSAASILESATSLAARSLGRSDLGSIVAGRTADLVAVDLSSPMTGPVFDPVQSMVYYGNGRDVTMTMVNGRILWSNNAFADVELGRARSAAQAAMDTIWDQALRAGLLSEVMTGNRRTGSVSARIDSDD